MALVNYHKNDLEEIMNQPVSSHRFEPPSMTPKKNPTPQLSTLNFDDDYGPNVRHEPGNSSKMIPLKSGK